MSFHALVTYQFIHGLRRDFSETNVVQMEPGSIRNSSGGGQEEPSCPVCRVPSFRSLSRRRKILTNLRTRRTGAFLRVHLSRYPGMASHSGSTSPRSYDCTHSQHYWLTSPRRKFNVQQQRFSDYWESRHSSIWRILCSQRRKAFHNSRGTMSI